MKEETKKILVGLGALGMLYAIITIVALAIVTWLAFMVKFGVLVYNSLW